MAGSSVAADLDETFDVKSGVSAEIALNDAVFVNVISQQGRLVLGQVFHAGIRVDACSFEDVSCCFRTDTVDISQTDLDSLFSRQVNTGYTSHSVAPPIQCEHVRESALTLFVFRVLANDHNAAFALDNLAFFTYWLYRRSYFHLKYLLIGFAGMLRLFHMFAFISNAM